MEDQVSTLSDIVKKDTPRIRTATQSDLPDLLSLCKELYEENGLTGVDWRLVGDLLSRATSGDGAVLGVIGSPGAIEGAIYLQISHTWYSKEPHLEELFSYVRPQFRRSINAKVLIEFAKKCSEQLKIPLLIGIISNHRTEQKIRLYRRQLGEQAGAFFLFNGHTGK